MLRGDELHRLPFTLNHTSAAYFPSSSTSISLASEQSPETINNNMTSTTINSNMTSNNSSSLPLVNTGWLFNEVELQKRQAQQLQAKLQQQKELQSFLQQQASIKPTARKGRRQQDEAYPTTTTTTIATSSSSDHFSSRNMALNNHQQSQNLNQNPNQNQNQNQNSGRNSTSKIDMSKKNETESIPFPALPSFLNAPNSHSSKTSQYSSSTSSSSTARRTRGVQFSSASENDPHNHPHSSSSFFTSSQPLPPPQSSTMLKDQGSTMTTSGAAHPIHHDGHSYVPVSPHQGMMLPTSQINMAQSGHPPVTLFPTSSLVYPTGMPPGTKERESMASASVTPTGSSLPSSGGIPPYMTYYAPSMLQAYAPPPIPTTSLPIPSTCQVPPSYPVSGYLPPPYPYTYTPPYYPYLPVLPPTSSLPPTIPQAPPAHPVPATSTPTATSSSSSSSSSIPTLAPAPPQQLPCAVPSRAPPAVSAEAAEAQQKRRAYQQALDQQLLEKKQRDEQEKQREAREQRQLATDMQTYQPFGKGGAGAPMVRPDGTVVTVRVKPARSPTPAAQSGGGGGAPPAADGQQGAGHLDWERVQEQRKVHQEKALHEALQHQMLAKEQAKVQEKVNEKLKELKELERLHEEQRVLQQKFKLEAQLELPAVASKGSTPVPPASAVLTAKTKDTKPVRPQLQEELEHEEMLRRKAEEEALKRKHKLRRTPVPSGPTDNASDPLTTEAKVETKSSPPPAPRPIPPPSPPIPTLRGTRPHTSMPTPLPPTPPSAFPAPSLVSPSIPDPSSSRPISGGSHSQSLPREPTAMTLEHRGTRPPTATATTTAEVLDRLSALKKVLDMEQKKVAEDLSVLGGAGWNGVAKHKESGGADSYPMIQPPPLRSTPPSSLSQRPPSATSSLHLEVLERVNAARMRKLNLL